MTAPTPVAPRRVEKPWGYELIWAHTDRYVGKILHIEQGHALSYQYHRTKDETIYLLSGRLQLDVAEDDAPPRAVMLEPGASFRISTGLRHRMTAITSCDVLDASTPEVDDVVRLEDRYGRAGTSKA